MALAFQNYLKQKRNNKKQIKRKYVSILKHKTIRKQPMKPLFILAPLRGITDHHFRTIFSRHFRGFSMAVAPFISPQKNSAFPDSMLKDILPDNNRNLPVIPQLLHNETDSFLRLAERLIALGYRQLNWNLGCPAPQVVKKRRGSAMLSYPEKITALLDVVLPELEKRNCTLSIKMRSGYFDHNEGMELLALLNNYPLADITIHPRLGKDIYRGDASPDIFNRCARISRHPLIYNGDIVSKNSFSKLCSKIDTEERRIKGFMIGRGAVANPLLFEEIQDEIFPKNTPDKKRERIENFHEELFSCYREILCGDSHILGRMKIMWSYLAASFPEKGKRELKAILKSRNQEQYKEAIAKMIAQ